MFLSLLERNGFHDSIWRDLDRLQSEFRKANWQNPDYPAINLYANEDEALLISLVPGFSPDKLEISVMENTVTLSGKRELPERKEGQEVVRQELHGSEFYRTIELPFRADSNKVEASYKNGVLQVTVPRLEADKPRKIAVVSEK